MSDSPAHGGSVLVLNAGSSSLKYELIDASTGNRRVRGLFDRIGHDTGRHHHSVDDVANRAHGVDAVSYDEAIHLMLDAFDASGPTLDDLVGVGHRVVHGGSRFTGPVVVDAEVVRAIEELVPLAPLHNQVSLDCIATVAERLPDTPQVAVFDTAFHATVPDRASAFAIPHELAQAHGLRRYGFHGTSVDYVTGQAAALLGRERADTSLIVCHLGNGASVTAVKGGRSIDTSMGFSPLGGLAMGTRSGDIDASVVLYLLDQVGMSTAEVGSLLNTRSGLQGLTGDADMRRVRGRAERGEPQALRALAIYTHRVRSYIGAYLAALPALDALVFTGGIGENDDRLRREVCAHLSHLGIELDPRANLNAEGGGAGTDIGSGALRVLVVPTDEERQIALQTIELISSRPKGAHRVHHAPATA